MESPIGSNLFLDEETHGFKVKRHVNWDFKNWVAITPMGSVVVFRDRTDWTLYAVYSPHKGRYHVHVPYNENLILFNAEDSIRAVITEVLTCINHAECFIAVEGREMVYSMNPLSLRGFIPFGTGNLTPITDRYNNNKAYIPHYFYHI